MKNSAQSWQPISSGGNVQTGLPSGGDTADPAESDEQQRLDAAVPFQIHGGVLAQVVDRVVPTDIGVHHVRGDEIIDAARFDQRVCFVTDDFGGQRAEVRGKNDVGGLFDQVFGMSPLRWSASRSFGGHRRVEDEIVYMVHIAELDPEFLFALKVLRECDRPLQGIGRSDGHFPWTVGENMDFGDLAAFPRQRQVDENRNARSFERFLYP